IEQFRERAEWVRKSGQGRIYMGSDLERFGSLRYLYQLTPGRRGCPMQVMFNGLPVFDVEQLDFIADISYVEGVEVYRSQAQIPDEFSHLGACALMLVWTKPVVGKPFSWKRLFIMSGITLATFLFYF